MLDIQSVAEPANVSIELIVEVVDKNKTAMEEKKKCLIQQDTTTIVLVVLCQSTGLL